MKIITTFFLVFTMSYSGFSQSATYNIADYLYPDVQRKYLRFNPDLNFSTNEDTNTKYSYGIADLDLYGFNYLNTRKRQLTLSYNLGLGYNYNSTDSPYANGRDKLFGNTYVDITNKLFFKPKRFFEIDAFASFEYDQSTYQSTENKNEIRYFVDVSPKIGFGRIELVSDAWHAVTIIEELQKAGCIKKELSHLEITLLAEEISQLKNYRNVDNRIEAIYEFENLAKYFIDNGYSDPNTYRFFSILKDAYDYENFAIRENGQQFSAGINLYREYFDNSLEASQIWNTYGLQFEYEKRKAISTNWQYDQSYKIKGGRWNYSPPSSIAVNSFNYAEAEINQTIGYFLSQRTNFHLRLVGFYRLFLDSDSKSLNLSIEPAYQYYISPQLRLYCRARINYSDVQDGALFDYYAKTSRLSVGINYFIY